MQESEEMAGSEKVLILPLSEDSKKITQILANDKAMKVLEVLTDKPMSATDVAEKLSMPLTTIKYNIDALVGVDLLKVKQTKWSKKGREIKIYEPVKKFIVVAPGSLQRDRSSMLNMLKKYLGLTAGAVFAAAGLELLARNRVDDFALSPASTSSDALDVYKVADNSRSVVYTDIVPSPEMYASGRLAVNNTSTGNNLTELAYSGTVNNGPTTADNLSLIAEPGLSENVSSLLPYDILSHHSVWFLFGCLFIIVLLLVRELYYRKKNI